MENRSVIVAEYKVYSTFVVPKDIDIYDKEQVTKFWVKYDVLHIEMENGDTIKVEPYSPALNGDFKRPEDITFESAEENGIDEEYEDDKYVTTWGS